MAGNPDEWPSVIAPDAFDSQVGKTVPLRLGVGGPIVGRATLRDGGRVEMVLIELPDLQGTDPPGS